MQFYLKDDAYYQLTKKKGLLWRLIKILGGIDLNLTQLFRRIKIIQRNKNERHEKPSTILWSIR